MGQMAVGILYGVEAPELPVTDDDPEPLHDLVDRWEKAKKIDWLQRGVPRVRVETEGGLDLLGVWVAQGGCTEDGAEPFLEECVLLADVSNVFAKRIKAAEKLWNRFAAWCAKNEGVKLPLPKLWLTPCETA